MGFPVIVPFNRSIEKHKLDRNSLATILALEEALEAGQLMVREDPRRGEQHSNEDIPSELEKRCLSMGKVLLLKTIGKYGD